MTKEGPYKPTYQELYNAQHEDLTSFPEKKAMSERRATMLGTLDSEQRESLKEAKLKFISANKDVNPTHSCGSIEGMYRGNKVSLNCTLQKVSGGFNHIYGGTVNGADPLAGNAAKDLFEKLAPLARFQTYVEEENEKLGNKVARVSEEATG